MASLRQLPKSKYWIACFTVRGWFEHWLSTQKAINSTWSLARCRGQVEQFLNHLEDRSECALFDLERLDIRAVIVGAAWSG